MRIGSGLSTNPEPSAAAAEATAAAMAALGGEVPTLAMLFVSPHHAAAAAGVLAEVNGLARPDGLIGCVGESIVGGSREVEGEPAVSVWLGSLAGGVRTFHVEFDESGAFAGWEPPSRATGGSAALVTIGDPFTFPVDRWLDVVREGAPGLPVVGGLASGARQAGATVLFRDGAVHRSGAVAALIPGAVAVRSLVSQGCRPIGSSFIVTRADRNVLQELGGRPPLERLRETVRDLAPADRDLLAGGLHIGRVIDEYRTEFGPGDFLIRGVMGADPETGAIAVGDLIEVGQTVQFHVRDAATADEELRSLLEATASSLPGRPAGALLFTCNGRGSRLFSAPDHDAALVSSRLDGAPLAGFFCAGELGPVGGRNFLHGFTASLVVFVDRRAGGVTIPSSP